MIIGISGAVGAGKDTAADYIERAYGFSHVSGGDILRDMLKQLRFEPTKNAVRDLGTLLRSNYGSETVLKLVIEKGGKSDIVISGFRSPDEARLMHESGGTVLYIDAPQRLRHERVLARARLDDRGIDLVALDSRESKSSNSLEDSLEDVRNQADFVISNDGTIESFFKEIDSVISEIQSPTSS